MLLLQCLLGYHLKLSHVLVVVWGLHFGKLCYIQILYSTPCLQNIFFMFNLFFFFCYSSLTSFPSQFNLVNVVAGTEDEDNGKILIFLFLSRSLYFVRGITNPRASNNIQILLVFFVMASSNFTAYQSFMYYLCSKRFFFPEFFLLYLTF